MRIRVLPILLSRLERYPVRFYVAMLWDLMLSGSRSPVPADPSP